MPSVTAASDPGADADPEPGLPPADWIDHPGRAPTDTTVHALFRAVAARHPQRIALRWPGGELRYDALDRRSDALARRLLEPAPAPGERIAVCLPRSADAVVAVLAVLKAGAAYLPLDPALPDARLRQLLDDAGARIALVDAAQAPRMAGLAPHVLQVAGVATAEDVDAGLPPPATGNGGSLAYVMYTSGSTGVPKGVQIEHRSILRLVCGVDYVRLDADTCFLHAAPLGFDASTLELWGPLLNGGCCAILDAPVPDAAALGNAIATLGADTAWLTAALFNAVVDEAPQALRGLRALYTGGEALSPAHVRRAQQALPGLQLHNGYGPTECTTFATTHAIPPGLPEDATAIPIGRAIAGTRLRVLDAAMQPVAIGVEGELYLGGDGLARGYLGRPELDAERFLPDPFLPGARLYRTGDLVRWRPDGALDFLGRADRQLKIRGFRIEPGEIEAALARQPGVRASAVVADDGPAGRRLLAYVVGDAPDPAALRAALAAELPDFMLPAALVPIAALPLTANGKLDRAALPRPAQARPAHLQPARAPRDGREAQACAAFAQVLSLDAVGADDAFFELGGDSLSALRLLALLRREGIADLRPAQLFSAPTPAGVARLAEHRAGDEAAPSPRARRDGGHDEPIAIVGMAGRFPGADDVEAFWRNLCEGRESIRLFTPGELDPSIPAALRDDPDYVRARGVLDGVDRFDAAFFGISPLEAQLTDPQHRHFLECAWHALEHAGVVPEAFDGRIGVYGGMYNASYLEHHVRAHPELAARLGALPVMLANEKDYLATRVAWKLGLDGPAVGVHTACSTSLVATSLAIDALRAGHCDLALAGGVAITCPPDAGYLHQDGSMASPDGHTRTFDAGARGTVFSDGVAILALRRLSDAQAAGDTIYALLLGGAVNNDGADRASFTAPNPAGQSAVVAMAHDAAGIDARDIAYVEAHGTATPIGDPIEVEGLSRAFRRHTADTGFCGIGSLKSNVGHMVTAAGAAGVIKTALALHRGLRPPTINFSRPNPQIDFAATPFVPQAALQPWPRGERPRLAGVSAFGFGGTNAHVVLREAPEVAPSPPSPRASELLVLSARTPQALDAACARMAAFLADAGPGGGATLPLADVAHTTRTGRRAFVHRRHVVATDHADAIAKLSEAAAGARAGAPSGVAFLFPGQGAQYPGMGARLHAGEPAFREAHDACCAVLSPLLGEDAHARLLRDDPQALVGTAIVQPALFALEYSLAKLWMAWGITPTALAGHSIGEFVAATLAGVMSLDDALALVALRGRLMQARPAGAMLSVRLSADAVAAWLEDGLELAAENAPGLCVVAGPLPQVERLEARLAEAGIVARRLATSHAFHSAMMQPVVAPLRERLDAMRLDAPRIPIVSTVSGDWLTAAQARDPGYWSEHLRVPVRFAPAAARLLEDGSRVLLEVGPRATLATLARQCAPGGRAPQPIIASLADAPAQESHALDDALGRLWTQGVAPDWQARVAGEGRRKVPLPLYPFERQRHWIDAGQASAAPLPARDAAAAAPAAEAASVEAASVEAASVEAATVVPAVAQPVAADGVLPRLFALVEEVSGVEMTAADAATPWLELGLDSLALTQLALQLQRAFGVKVSFRQVMEQHGSAALLAAFLEAQAAPAGTTAASPIAATSAASAPASAPMAGEEGEGPQRYDVNKAFGAIARIHTRRDALTPLQRARLDALVARYTARTAKSKAYTTEHRPHMADPRVVNGFRPLTKELVYSIVVERSRGSRVWDIDGNEYIDVLNGFGMNLFGWQPDFLRETLHARIDQGYEIGPQHVLAGDAARLFCEVAGTERAAFCNTGSEAVMGAMRIARTVTGRSTIVMFNGAYHGIFDEVIARGTRSGRSVPAAPGILPEATRNILVLDYGTEETLQVLRARAHELAAILVEPVQSRRPDFRPVEFLRELRTLTEQSGALLIFDEVVTGFRAHPQGVQGLFGIRADIASYGKAVGGGFPIGVIAGKRAYMDALDGGHWQYGDDSVPGVGVTYFAGTFVRHPLALAATHASLQHFAECGPALQADLNARCAEMVARVNAAMAELGAPFKLVTFASWWRNVFTEDLPYGDLLYVMLRDRGIHILDNFPCFLTTAHSRADIDRIVEAYRDAAAEMIASGFFPVRRQAQTEAGVRRLPSTEPQREVWLADRLGPEASLAYNESVSLHLRGALDVERLRAAVAALPRRHDALRASFSDDGLWLCVPEDAAPLDVPLHDVSAAADPPAELAAVAARHVSEPFDLGRGPLLRAEVLRLAPDHHVLVLTGHHIVLDGWSFWVLVKDLAAACRDGAASATAPSFADYAQSRALGDATPADDLAWWASRFADGGPLLDLPLDRPRPAARSQRSARHDHRLPAALVAQLRALGAARGASLFATLIAGFSALLLRLTGQEDVVVGIPAAGQAAEEALQGLVGHCVHMLPLRLQPHAGQPFTALLDDSRGVLLDAYDHQAITFGQLLRALPLARDPARLPLISVMFNIDQALVAEHAAIPGVVLELAGNARRFETFELFVNAVDLGGDGMRLECQYNRDLFDAATIERWMACFERLLQGALHDPSAAVDALPLLGEADRRLLAQWNDTAAPYPHAQRIESLVLAQARRSPQAVAVRCGDEAMDYATLARRSAGVARALAQAGVARGDRVGLLLERDLSLLPALLGVLRAGACYVPLDPSLPADRIAFMATDAGLRQVLGDAALLARFGPALEGVDTLSLDAVAAAGDDDGVDPASAAGADADDDAYVLYTSGSTGRPKGVRVRHRNVVNLIAAMQAGPGLAAGESVLAITTLSFDIAVCELLLPLVAGAGIVLARREDAADPARLRALLARHRVDVMQATPATWRLLLEAGWEGEPRLRAWCGGEALPADLAAALRARTAALWNVYGPTETTVWSTCHRVDDDTAPVPIGRPLANTQLHVLDARRQPVPVGVVGELCIGGAGVARGYLGRDDLTAERFIELEGAGRVYRSGDLARWRNDGVMECLGRTDFQVKLRGYRIELGEIEQVLQSHPGVAQAVVVMHAPRPGDLRLLAYVVAREGAAPDEAALRAHAAQRLPEYMVPQRCLLLPVLPLTTSGKVDRKALPLPEPATTVADADEGIDDAPRSPHEARVAALFRELLALPRVARDADFFSLGGHSLLAAQLAARLGRELDRDVPLRSVFDHPSIARLAAWLATHDTAGATEIPKRAPGLDAPLSLMQQRVWYLEQLHPGRTVYHVPSAHRLSGPLDRDALERAFAALVARQPALRTVIGQRDGEPYQRVLDAVDGRLPFDDLRALPAATREDALARRIEDQVARPFDLATGPLFRARLFALDDDEHVLFFMAHHLVWDGWSFDLFYAEMAALYPALRDGTDPGLPPLALDYADFSAWHRDWMQGPELARQLAHWQARLDGAPRVLALPTDLARPPLQSGDGDTAWLRVPDDVADALRALARREGSTLFHVLLSAWALLLHQATGQRDLVVGTPVRGRGVPELEPVMGFFVNALPLRLQVDPAAGFDALLASVRREAVDAFGCQDVPFEHLVRVLDNQRDTSRFPIYQAFFSYQDARQRPCRWGGLAHANVPVFQPAAAQDLALWFLDGADGLLGGLNFNTDILLPATARRLGERYLALLARLAASPAPAVAALLAPGVDEAALLADWNDTARALPDVELSACLDTALAARATTVAIRHRNEDADAATLSAMAERIAASLAARGIGAGDVVGLHLARTPAMLAALLGVLRSGAAYLPLDPGFPPARLAFMAADAGARVVLVDAGVPDWLAPEQALALDVALACDAPFAARVIDPRAPAYLIYTSGSTGQPKGVWVPRRAVLNFLLAMREAPGLAAGARLAAVTTLSFDIAVLELLLPLLCGATIVLVDRDDASDGAVLRDLLERERVDAMQATPSTWRLLLEAGWRGGPRFKALCGGEALPPDLAEALLSRSGELWNLYGPTETTVWSTAAQILPGLGAIVVGRPIANTRVHVLDADGAPVPIGVAGEIVIAGEGVALGYHARPELDGERFVPDPDQPGARMYRTGDLGRWRGDGQLQHLGRMDGQVKLRGHRIETGEIEAALARHPDIAQAVVVLAARDGGDPLLAAYVVARPGAAPEPSALRAHLREHLPEYMVPGAWRLLERIPATPNGKVDRAALPPLADVAPSPSPKPGLRAATTPTERIVAEVWRELLGVADAGADDSFLDLGGHSLLIMRAVALLQARTGVAVGPRAFVFQTLGQIAAELDAQRAVVPADAGAAAVAPAPRGGFVGRLLRGLRRRREA